jgi:hypothetical protein
MDDYTPLSEDVCELIDEDEPIVEEITRSYSASWKLCTQQQNAARK